MLMMEKAISVGLPRGTKTCHKNRSPPHPSITAASSRARGICRKVCRRRKVPYPEAKKGSIIATLVLRRSNCFNVKKFGRKVAWMGIIIWIRKRKKKNSLPQKFLLAKT
jgi:hypothetical protein